MMTTSQKKRKVKGKWIQQKQHKIACQRQQLLCHSGRSASTSMIVPVWVSSTVNPYKEKLVGALLDIQSDAVFIDQEVSRELPVILKLTTMIGENAVVSSERVPGLCVRDCIHKGPYSCELRTHTNLRNCQTLESPITNHWWSPTTLQLWNWAQRH